MKHYTIMIISSLSLACCSCGGGTTGTSSTGELKLLGTSQGSQGSPLTETAMVVYSAESNDPLLASQTDNQGTFEMSLAPEEQGIAVEILGQRTAPLVRSYSGSSVVSTTLVQTSEGNLVFGDGFEVRIDSNSLCSGASAAGNSLTITAEQGSTPCNVTFETTSYGSTPFIISAEVQSDCDQIDQVSNVSIASADGLVQLALPPVNAQGCRPKAIVLRASAENLLPIAIPLR